MDLIIDCIKHKRPILVVSGAGTSTNVGISDFYTKLPHLAVSPNTFSRTWFDEHEDEYYEHIKQLFEYIPSFTHRFIRKLEIEGLLSYQITSNVDGLDQTHKLINMFGSVNYPICSKCCRKDMSLHEYKKCIESSTIPLCIKCNSHVLSDITCYEHRIMSSDAHKCVDYNSRAFDVNKLDLKPMPALMLIIGTTLSSYVMFSLVKSFNGIKIYISRSASRRRGSRIWNLDDYIDIDYFIYEDCDVFFKGIANIVGWI